MDNYILFQMHIMWYESEMVTETLDSISKAILHSRLPIKLKLCLNSQTYLEKPITGESKDMFNNFTNHEVFKTAQIINKTDEDPFYNIGDWRREEYDINAKYTVWGESDCLLPEDFFYILSSLEIQDTHLVSFASRKMWDSSWDCVEHEDLIKYIREADNIYQAPKPLNSCDVINQKELDIFNSKHDINILLNQGIKIDGSLLCISKGIDFDFIPKNMHFVREDFCAEQVFKIKRVPQYIVKTRIKGHNYSHPKKRLNTDNTRNDEIFKYYENESMSSMNSFLNNLKYRL